ncbi:hypothetical protein B0H13DRAFT_2038131 [Mycena leptocephala]|nr:hypothetical protein B0H13DRAFT_2038131 [Mycena leptocephala]
MPPLTTHPSVHSWWSESNPGPQHATINLHAAAKPFFRLAYRVQVRTFIKRNRGTPLSGTTMDIYSSYLAFRRYRYISPSTKISILEELSTRAEVDNEDARVVVESLVSQSDLVTELLLDSTDARIRRYMCKLLGSLTSAYQSSWDLKICARIVDLTSDLDIEVRESALHAIAKISDSPYGAEALWAVYTSEAEKYDKSLVESWKSNMEGMLIFAGLFSASLTAFLIESYRTLSPDSGDQTVKLLAQILQQLASSSNDSTLPISPPLPFTPSATSLICNALWFISLGLSLACALIATLVEQWARNFLHRADMQSSPLIRARIFSYLYYGMKRFNMHLVVDMIPLLLHASLILFFAGLVAFLVPVNIVMTVIAATLLVLVTTAYSVLTFLPLGYMDCPYRTPLSGVFWRLLQHSKMIFSRSVTSKQPETMVEAMTRGASEGSPMRKARDYRALVWTVKSLADDIELEPFVDALPDVLWGPMGRRHTYADHIRSLAHEVQLCSRIDSLYGSSIEGILSREASIPRQISSYKAFWAIASLAKRHVSDLNQQDAIDFHHVRAYSDERVLPPEVSPYAISAKTMMEWSTFCALYGRLEEHHQYLAHCQVPPTAGEKSRLAPVIIFLYQFTMVNGLPVNETAGYSPGPDHESGAYNIPELLRIFKSLRDSTPHVILFEYLSKSASLGLLPYRWEETRATISIDPLVTFTAFGEALERNLTSVIFEQMDIFSLGLEFQWSDNIVAELCSFWKPLNPQTIPSAIVYYLTHRNSEAVLKLVLQGSGIMPYLRSAFSCILSIDQNSSSTLLPSLWALAISDDFEAREAAQPYREILAVISKENSPFAQSTTALIKTGLLSGLSTYSRIDSEAVWHAIFPEDTRIPLSDPSDLSVLRLNTQITEAKMHVLVEFLEYCTSDELPYEAVATFRKISDTVPEKSIHKTHQIRFATNIRAIFASARSMDLMNAIVISKIPLDGIVAPRFPWLDEPIARQALKEAFRDYDEIFTTDYPESPPIRTRMRAILEGLDAWHPAGDPPHGQISISSPGESPEMSQAADSHN